MTTLSPVSLGSFAAAVTALAADISLTLDVHFNVEDDPDNEDAHDRIEGLLKPVLKHLADIHAAGLAPQEPARVAVDLTGGVFQGGWSNQPVEVIVLDYDPGDGWDEANAIEITAGNGKRDFVEALRGEMDVAPGFVDHIWRQAAALPVLASAPVKRGQADRSDEGPAGVVIDALNAMPEVDRAECFDGAESGYFALADGREFQVVVTPIETREA